MGRHFDLIFSIEMNSKHHVRALSMSDTSHDKVLFEGDLGSYEQISVTDGDMLEISGSYGVLRISLDIQELERVLTNKPGPQHTSKEKK